MERTDSQYEVLKLRVEEDVADQIRTFINDEGVVGVYMVTDAKRYYPYATLASQIIGFVGTDNYGLYGLEARYNDVLTARRAWWCPPRIPRAATCSTAMSNTIKRRTEATLC